MDAPRPSRCDGREPDGRRGPGQYRLLRYPGTDLWCFWRRLWRCVYRLLEYKMISNEARPGVPSDQPTLRSLVIAGTHSGVGKTTVALALMAALRQRGL